MADLRVYIHPSCNACALLQRLLQNKSSLDVSLARVFAKII